jgi:hypothetical protein
MRPPRYYVPLSHVRRWPPLPRLDLRDAEGRAVPFLTGRQNTVLDAAALQEVANLSTESEIDDGLHEEIAQVAVSENKQERAEALERVLSPPSETDRSATARAHRRLCRDPIFCAHAHALVANTLLWLRVEGWPEDREVVKFSYDVPVEPRYFGDWSPEALGTKPFVFELEVPHLGTTSSYHCNVVAPPPLEVVETALLLFEPVAGEDDEKIFRTQVRNSVVSSRPRPHSQDLDLYTGLAESQAKFYATGDRTGLKGRLRVAVLIQSQGLLGGALGASLASLAILAAFTILLCATVKLPEAAVAVLLVSPAVLGYLLIRPSEHVLAGGFLIALRRAVIGSGVPAVLGAATLALSKGHAGAVIYVVLSVLTVLQAGLVFVIARAYWAGRTWRKKLKPHPDASLLD